MATHSLDDAERKKYKEVFRMFDADQSGTMDLKELGDAMRRLKQHPTLQELKAMMRECDANNSGTLDEEEFLDLVARRVAVSETRDDLLGAFRLFDDAGKGTVTSSELRQLLTTVGEPLTESEVDKVLKAVKVLPSGEIDYADFVDVIMH